jgi:hypothetical protein
MKARWLVLALLLTTSQAAPQPQQGNSVIQGTVKRFDTGEPIDHVQVTLSGRPQETVTDSDGHYVFRNVPPGQYNVSAQREGYFHPYGLLRSSKDEPSVHLTVSSERDLKEADFELALTTFMQQQCLQVVLPAREGSPSGGPPSMWVIGMWRA